MSKQEELLNDVADEVNDMKRALDETKKEVAELKDSVNALTEALTAKSQEKKQSETDKDTAIRNAVVSALDFLKKQNNITNEPLLSNADYKKFADIALKKYREEFKKANKAYDETYEKRSKEEQEELSKQRIAQGIETIEQVQEWAPDYPPEIQRTIRYIGRRILPENESPESAHIILRVWGDALMRITMKAKPEPPTFISWVKYRSVKFWKSTDKWSAFRCYVVLLSAITIVLFASMYQSSVMDLDRTNRLFYKQVMKTEQGRKDYHELDSLIHNESFFKTYRTLDK